MPTDLDPIAVLSRTDPAAGRPVPDRPPLDELVALPSAGAAPDRRRAVVLAAAVLLAVLLAGAALLVATDADRDTTPATETDVVLPRLPLTLRQPAGPALLALADRLDVGYRLLPAAEVAYARTVSRTQAITVDDGGTSIAYESSLVERWTDPDGRTHTSRWPAPPARRGSVVQVDADLPLPEAGAIEGGPAFHDPLARPQDDAALRADLRVGAGGSAGGPAMPYNALERVVEILSRQPVGSADRAAMYRILAGVDGIEHRGLVVDRAGRDGIAFSYESDFSGALSELIVVVDPDTGELLESEEVMLGSAPAIPIDEPVVTSYTIVLTIATVAEWGDRP